MYHNNKVYLLPKDQLSIYVNVSSKNGTLDMFANNYYEIIVFKASSMNFELQVKFDYISLEIQNSY